MSVKWTGIHSESGILRKSEFKEKKEELFVFGYSCKLFRDDDKALHIDQGKHLIPWMGDESLKIDRGLAIKSQLQDRQLRAWAAAASHNVMVMDAGESDWDGTTALLDILPPSSSVFSGRYDARGALHDLSALEAPPGGYDWRVELTRNELDVEQLCDEERYRALHTDEDEEEMYKEEELKRLHAAGYGQVGFNYESPAAPPSEPPPQEIDEPFQPTPAFKALLPPNVLLPETQKQNAIIEKTAKFIASHGTQMEILIKAKQADNPQFQFLNKDSKLHPYYTALIALIKTGKWPEKTPEVVEEKQQELNDEYLHPSLASTIIESAPSIPSIAYRPSADCDYRLLVSRLRGSPPPRDTPPPPGTAPLPPPPQNLPLPQPLPLPQHHHPLPRAHIVRGPVLLSHAPVVEAPAQKVIVPSAPPVLPPPTLSPAKSTGLSLMQNYDSGTDSESDFEDTSKKESGRKEIAAPPEEVRLVIDKMAAYVARNGDEFADIVRAKNDPRFTFLEPDNIYHAYYKKLMQEKRAVTTNGGEMTKSSNAVVSFSIKKHKEPDPILPKPALPYESSSDEESEESKQEKTEDSEKRDPPKTNIPEVPPFNHLPPVVVYKIESVGASNNLPIIKSIEPAAIVKPPPKINPVIIPQVKEVVKISPERIVPIVLENQVKIPPQIAISKVAEKKEKVEMPEQNVETAKSKVRPRESPSSRENRKREKKREHRSKSESRESRRIEVRSGDRDKKEKEHNRDRKRRRTSRDAKKEEATEIISLVDNSDDLIDLTGEQSDSKGAGANGASGCEGGTGRRTAALLQRAGALPTTSLASAMVDTLETLRKKKAAEEEKRRRHERRRRRDRRDHDEESSRHRKSKRRRHKSSDEERSDHESSKRKKRKKDKKHTSRDKKKKRKDTETEEEMLPINIDLTNTLKELRTASPTKELGLDKPVEDQRIFLRDDSSDEDLEDSVKGSRKKRREQREYSEGEWSSESNDGYSTPDRKADS